MKTSQKTEVLPVQYQKKSMGKRLKKAVSMYKWLYIIMIPGLIYYIVFKYAPMWGVLIAFQDYNPYTGFGYSWVGFGTIQPVFYWPQICSCIYKHAGNFYLKYCFDVSGTLFFL